MCKVIKIVYEKTFTDSYFPPLTTVPSVHGSPIQSRDILKILGNVSCWHDLDNTEYDCWPVEQPNEQNMIDCGGLEMAWVLRPPEKVTSGQEFNVTYSLTVSDYFYENAVRRSILPHGYISNASKAKAFCEEADCPLEGKDATEDNCCVYHANIHSCPLEFMVSQTICGPWVPDDGKIVTHTVSQAGKMTHKYWSSKVVLINLGITSLIAHIKVGHLQAALEAKSTVLSTKVCGDGICNPDESCAVCPNDCGPCPLPVPVKLAIGLPLALFCSGFIFAVVWFQYHRQKMLWDESWIIQVNNLPEKEFQSVISSAASFETNNGPHPHHCSELKANTVLTCCTLSESFIQTGTYDGRRVAIKQIKKKNFVLSKAIRKEVQQVRNDDLEEFTDKLNKKQTYIYTPPEEVLGNSSSGTPAGDVYSYAMILLEIASRCDPFPDDAYLKDVTWRPPLPELTPGKSDQDCPSQADYSELIERCWAHNPMMRPSFEQIKKSLEKMNPNRVSPVDMMMNLMEKYSKHLEAIVAERTQDLLEEKQKTDRLLYSMLPKPVADNLRQGHTAEAQNYSSATVYFSDIVGFTAISGTSTPQQVVMLLNKLYTKFDDIIDNHDVYKVETIGDAYMVVSGVPKENGIRHVAEIANMALNLVAVCHSFKIPHLADAQLQIRAGLHSGPVVAGVVGTKMPRYCLFGDTVNTASRMESTSEALRIQCSSSAAELLQELGGYILTCRGTLNVKGKGEMRTWWLQGKADGTCRKNPL
ncbi:retinal guanylyl cyclase 2 [Microcaecilia unicolor]|uniref:guanylate cyclase n=1 Tax=Microcaecilia unicolor TaxID=1415580 RepID=A0A6P7YC14_9AMPH|nr:retinal guanylyl cyclase 2-like [Microcaecilia unicolor]